MTSHRRHVPKPLCPAFSLNFCSSSTEMTGIKHRSPVSTGHNLVVYPMARSERPFPKGLRLRRRCIIIRHIKLFPCHCIALHNSSVSSACPRLRAARPITTRAEWFSTAHRYHKSRQCSYLGQAWMYSPTCIVLHPLSFQFCPAAASFYCACT